MNYCYSCFKQVQEGLEVCPGCGKPLVLETPSHRLKPGTQLRDRYIVGRALGEGGFGITYVGFDTVLQMKVAVKEFFPNGFSNRDHNDSAYVTIRTGSQDYDFLHDMQRFLDEARTLAKFSDESGVVGVRDFFKENNTAYIIMEFLDGITLKDYIRKGGLIPATKLVAVLDPVLASLSRVHESGLIHRDISPDNIMVLRNGRLKLLDFGAARDVSGEKSLSVVLKPGYAPEEQYRTRGHQGSWTDVYAMSATMYKCITGKTPLESLERVYDDTLKKPSELGIAISPALEDVIMRGLTVRARDRIQTIDELRRQLKEASGNESASISRPNPVPAPVETEDDKTVLQSHPGGNPASAPVSDEPEDRTVVEPAKQPNVTGARSRSQLPPVKTGNRAPVKKNPPENNIRHDPAKVGTKGGKTKNRKVSGAVLAVAAVMGIAVTAFTLLSGRSGPAPELSQSSGSTRYTLTSSGTVSDPERSLRFDTNAIYAKTDNTLNLYSMLDETGRDVTGGSYVSVTGNLGHDLATGTLPLDDPNCKVLISGDGTVLIDEPASYFEWPSESNPAQNRFLLVYYADGSGTEDNYLVARKDGKNYNYKVDGATLYNGTIRVYDLEKKAFVPNTPDINRPGRVQVVNDCLLFRDNDDTYPLLDASGKEVSRFSGNHTSAYGGYGIVRVDDGTTYRIYDTDGNCTYYANTPMSIVCNTQYLEYTDSNNCRNIMDKNGNLLLKLEKDLRVTDYIAKTETFVVYDGENYGMVDLSGKEVLPVMYEYIGLGNLDGYGHVRYGKDKYSVFGPEGFMAVGLDYSGYDLCLRQDKNYYVFNDRAYTLQTPGGCVSLSEALLSVPDATTGLWGVYDLFTGEKLLDHVYEKVQFAYGNVYAYRNGAWEVYQAELIFG